MKSFNQGITRKSLGIAAGLMLAFCVLGDVRAAAAKDPPISVIAHITVPGTPAKQMLLQRQDGREYLYLLRSSGNGFTVLDVTNPKKPDIVKKITFPADSSTNSLDLVGSDMAIVEQSRATSAPLAHAESIQLLDLRNPANPRSVQALSGVTSVLAEDGRHLVYISNNNGLWILRRPTKSTALPCTSSDALSAFPDCN